MLSIAWVAMMALAVNGGGLQVERGSLPVNGARLAFEVAGKGPAVVLIHAGVADMTVWDEPFRELSKHFRVLRYDTRGFGESVTEAVAFSNRADLLALMDHLRIDRAVIVGNSRGGQIAVDFALEHPSRVSGLVFVAGGLSGFDKTPAGVNKNPTAGEKAVFEKIDALYEKKEFEKAAELEAAVWASGPEQKPDRAPSTIRERLRKMILHNARTHTTEPKPIPLDPPAAMRLGELRVPVLVMIGDLDESVTRSMAEYLATHAPRARKVVYRNTAHMISLEHPKEFVQEVTAFAQTASDSR
jgi:pimeloyl-ACP methyl ester carboxylesterase